MKKCHLCAEEIQDDAVKCGHCGGEVRSAEGVNAAEIRISYTNLAMLCHLGTFSGIIIPFGNILAPLIIWLWKKNESELVDDQGRESLNFQISLLLYSFLAGILMFVFVGFILMAVIVLFGLVEVIKASIRASNGEKYRYPLNLRFIR
ncbi:MAG: DUF4870 domain-containing protein [Candidatus Omnitrophica bacterium]|nr:DUF4870 domain-containing protein [Candidatus Omnitrophota bacterium]MDD5488267.1 DUF4870 domain-containing protein [Candidatus Omnitrophota bacterium]